MMSHDARCPTGCCDRRNNGGVVASVLLLLPALAVVIARRMRPDGENIIRAVIAGTYYAVALLLPGLNYGLQLLTHTEQPSVVCALSSGWH